MLSVVGACALLVWAVVAVSDNDTPPVAAPQPNATDLPQGRPVQDFGPNRPLLWGLDPLGWEQQHYHYRTRSTQGPQGAEAIVYWTSFSDSDWGDRCPSQLTSVGPSIGDLAAAVAAAPGTEVVSGPSDVTLDGRPAQRVVLTVEADLGCDPGYFYTWQPHRSGAFWSTADVGDTLRVWLVMVNGERLLIVGQTHDNVGPKIEGQIQQIVDSVILANASSTAIYGLFDRYR